ncbi:MAG: Fic family protein [Deltaproteobacteria bacterium]|nr:Fic family protein [Deltaproteobacteria bacterium]
MKIFIPTVNQIIDLNKYLCIQGRNPHICLDRGRIESALHSAFYPGSYPFAAGGIVKVAVSLCFYIVKGHPFMDGNKRTGTLVAIIFLNENSWDLKYPIDKKNNLNALASVIEDCAVSKVSKENLMLWFENHKVRV